jgi:hypothetical protein
VSDPLDDLIAWLQHAPAASAPPGDRLACMADADFAAFVARTRGFAVDATWLEHQAMACRVLGRKLAILNLALEEATAADHAYASGATSGGEGMARMDEISAPGFNAQADRLRALIRKSILG